jgi:hypothetical protein
MPKPPRKSKDAVLIEIIRNKARLRDLEVIWPLLRAQIRLGRRHVSSRRNLKVEG